MPPRRPPIPADVKRAVLVEAGHRCAISTCRAETTEIAHIVAWAKSKDNSFENLIALCPNCHTRYDQKKEIDLQAVKLYKAKLGEQNKMLSMLENLTAQQHQTNQKTEQLAVENQQLKAALTSLSARLNNEHQASLAREGLKHHNLQPTANYLRDVAKQARAEGDSAKAAEVMRELASISPTAEALQALQLAAEYEPDNALNWDLLGDTQRQAGNLSQAESAYRTLLRLTTVANEKRPRDNNQLRDLGVSHNRIGDIQQAQGDLSGALLSYRASLTIRERLAQHDAENTQWQRDLSVSHANIGDIQKIQNNLNGALASYRKTLGIQEHLAQHDTTNTEWQRDLSISHDRIGDIQQAQGDTVGALVSYRTSLTISERLAQHDAANTEWRRDVSISHNKIGDIQQAQGDTVDALVSYRAGLTIAERLALHDAANVQWQTDVVISCVKLSSLRGQGVSDQEAAGYLQRALDIAERLQREGKLNAQQQGWVEDLRERLAEIGAK